MGDFQTIWLPYPPGLPRFGVSSMSCTGSAVRPLTTGEAQRFVRSLRPLLVSCRRQQHHSRVHETRAHPEFYIFRARSFLNDMAAVCENHSVHILRGHAATSRSPNAQKCRFAPTL